MGGLDGLSGLRWVFFGGAALGLLAVAALFALLWLLTRHAHWGEEEEVSSDPEWEALETHPFYPVSKRARTGYLVLCLEEVLKAAGEDLERWKWVRRELWSVTRRPDEEWAARICDLMPVEVLSVSAYTEFDERRRETVLPGYAFSEIEWKHFRALYEETKEDTLEQVIYVMAQAVDMVLCDCGEGELPHTPDALHYIDETRAWMEARGIPIPHDEAVLYQLLRHHHPHSGKPFDPPVSI